jgi:hypothetical protein
VLLQMMASASLSCNGSAEAQSTAGDSSTGVRRWSTCQHCCSATITSSSCKGMLWTDGQAAQPVSLWDNVQLLLVHPQVILQCCRLA